MRNAPLGVSQTSSATPYSQQPQVSRLLVSNRSRYQPSTRWTPSQCVARWQTNCAPRRPKTPSQPAWPAGVFRIRIDAPPGAVIDEASDDLEVGGVSARYVGTPTRPFSVWVRIA